jgi:tRNA G18 (ribose-2'-O)-methylase SpoU
MAVSLETLDDPRLEPFRVVADPAALKARGLFVAEGRLVVERLLDDGRFAVESVLVTPPSFAALRDRIERSGVSVLVAPQPIVNGVTGFNFHRGCLALARRPVEEPDVDALCGAGPLILLEGVGNPDNVGGIFRAALALGAAGIVLDHATADPLYRKAIRTSMGAALRVPFVRVPAIADALPTLRAAGFRILALTPASDAVDIADVPRSGRMAMLLGAEGAGLTPEARGMADVCARIPIATAADSLNVAVAAAIALHVLR